MGALDISYFQWLGMCCNITGARWGGVQAGGGISNPFWIVQYSQRLERRTQVRAVGYVTVGCQPWHILGNKGHGGNLHEVVGRVLGRSNHGTDPALWKRCRLLL